MNEMGGDETTKIGQFWSPDSGDVSPDMVLVCLAGLKNSWDPSSGEHH